jgi:hypothetical protein
MTAKNQTERAVIVRDTTETRTALMSRFGQEFNAGLSIGQFLGLANLYGLNPFLSHCTAIQGRFYIEREGWLHIINREAPGQLVGLIDARVGTPEEYEMLRVPTEDFLAFASITRRATPEDEPQTFRRHAIVPQRMTMPTKAERELLERKPNAKVRHIVEDPWDMAMKQATVRVLRMAFNDLLLRLDLGDVRAGPTMVGQVPPEEIEGSEAPAIGPPDAGQTIEEASTRAEPPAKSAATSENGLDWSRLWSIASEAGMDRAAVHQFFKVPDREGALKDEAYARAGKAKQAPVQIVADMADQLEADIRGRQDPGPPPEPERPLQPDTEEEAPTDEGA